MGSGARGKPWGGLTGGANGLHVSFLELFFFNCELYENNFHVLQFFPSMERGGRSRSIYL